MGIQLAGIFSQIDTDLIVAKIMEVNERPVRLLQQRKNILSSRAVAVDDIGARINELKKLAGTMRNINGSLRATGASSSDQDVLTVSASTTAFEGAHTVVVNRLATTQKEVHDGVATEETLVGTGQLVYTYGTAGGAVTRTIQTTAETTLESLRDLINNDGANPGVSASILEYDAGGGQVYHLVLGGKDSGSDNDITIEATTTLDGTGGTVDFTNSIFTVTQAAQDSQVRVDGYPSGDWIERSSNTVTEVVPGVSITLKTTGTANVTVTRDTSGLKQDLRNLVAIYNGIVEKAGEYTGYSAETGLSGILQGDSTTSIAISQIRNLFVGTPAGFDESSDTFILPADIGLEIGGRSVSEDGTSTLDPTQIKLLSFDEDTFDEAIAENYLDVLSLLGTLRTARSDDDYIKGVSSGDLTEAGEYDVEVDFDGVGNITQARIQKSGESAWSFLDINGNELAGAVGTTEEGLQLTAAWDGASATQTVTVQVPKGLATTVYDLASDMLDSTTGLIEVKKSNIESASDTIDDRIEMMQDRLASQEKVLKAKYARLEAMLSQLAAQGGAFDALFQSLASAQQVSGEE